MRRMIEFGENRGSGHGLFRKKWLSACYTQRVTGSTSRRTIRWVLEGKTEHYGNARNAGKPASDYSNIYRIVLSSKKSTKSLLWITITSGKCAAMITFSSWSELKYNLLRRLHHHREEIPTARRLSEDYVDRQGLDQLCLAGYKNIVISALDSVL